MGKQRWGGGYGTTSLPFNAALDLGSEQTVTMVEIWRRNDSMVTDLANVECYAAESLDYSDKENIKYTNLTYLGKLDFEGSSDRVRVFPLFRPFEHALPAVLLELQAGSAVSIATMPRMDAPRLPSSRGA